MDKEFIRRNLPEDPPEGLLNWAQKEFAHDLGGEYCVFQAERYPEYPSMGEILERNSFAPKRTKWAARCTCSNCYEDFITRKEPGSDNILLIQGEDGQYYTIEPWETVDPYMGIEMQRPGDTFLCPMCGEDVRLIHSKKLRGGRIKQIMAVTVQNVEGYTGIFYWLVYRIINEFAISEYGVSPKDAFILTENGGLVRYAHEVRTGWYGSSYQLSQWKLMTTNNDSIDDRYHDWGSINNQKVGAFIYKKFPDLEGTTGEKTGLIEYLKADGYRPVIYLKRWRCHRALENLCKCGQAKLVVEIIRNAYRYSYSFTAEAEKYIDLSKRKPHEMLRLTKGEFKQVRNNKLVLTMDVLEQWRRYQIRTNTASFYDYLKYRELFTHKGMDDALEFMKQWPDGSMDKLARYMQKQGLQPREVKLLFDTREMAARLYADRVLTREELWPQRLIDAHDRFSLMLEDRNNEDLTIGFARVREMYGHLEWTDGDLCIILPKLNSDLVMEGRTLRHCVGGYGKSHASGSSLIFFVRKYRRPERSYYTLNISMKGRPKELQLHGYGNERHGPNKEYWHSIPAKVREFCDRWENEILLPWYAEKQRQQKEEMTA